MKSTKYSNFCFKKFGWVFSKHKKSQLYDKNIILEKANIAMDYDEYYATSLMNILIGFASVLIFSLLLYRFLPSPYTSLLIFILPALTVFSLGFTYLYLPTHIIKKRSQSIDRFLPYAINFISSMAEAGVSPSEIFQTLSTIDVYGEVKTESKRIAKEINIMGIDNITALKHAIELSPSQKLKAFLQGMIGTIQSGSDLHNYLDNIVEKFMDDDLLERKKNLDLLSVVAETFVISAIAFPIFLVIILSVMGFFGGSMEFSIFILFLFSFFILPLVYVGFYILIRSTSVEEISKAKYSNGFNVNLYGGRDRNPILVLVISMCTLILFISSIYLFDSLGYVTLNSYFIYDILFLTIIFLIGPVGFYSYFKNLEHKEIQRRLPEFLVEVGDSLSSGMTTFEAIKTAEKGRYGRLNPEIKKMKSQLSWNISLDDIFNDFASRMKSTIIWRIVITINEGLVMGGNTSKIFKAAAKEVDQVNQIEHQRQTNMSIYTTVIILCFFIFLAIILILDRTIFSSFFSIQSQQVERIGNAFEINVVEPLQLKYSLFSFVFIQSVGAGILSGFMTDDNLSSGVRYGCILGIVSFIAFKLLV